MRALATSVIALVLMLVTGWSAQAHTRSETHSNWRITGQTVHLTFTVPELEAKRLTADGSQPSDQRLSDYLAINTSVTADGQACPRQGPPQAAQAVTAMRRFELTFACPSDHDMALSSHAFYELVPSHTNFAQIQTNSGLFIEQLFTKDEQTLNLSDAGAGEALSNASFFKYVSLGLMHIFTGIDHQCFLLGLLLLSRKLRDLIFVITGFTIGHSITLALAVTGVLRPHAEFIDALVGLTIALVGAEVMADTTRKSWIPATGIGLLLLAMLSLKLWGVGLLPGLLLVGGAIFSVNYLMLAAHLQKAARLRLIVTIVFGLIHGFGFAAELIEMRLPKARLAELLVGFNIGVELGQLTVVLAAFGVVTLLMRLKLAAPRRMVADFGAAGLMGLGLFWFVSRSF